VVANTVSIQKGIQEEPDDVDQAFRGSFSGHERDRFFINLDDPNQFADIAYHRNLDFSDDGRSFAPVDIDGDGDLDLPFMGLQGLRLSENRLGSEGTHFSRVRLQATKTERHALGAEVVLHCNGTTQRDYVKATAGFQTQIPLDLHFGLGSSCDKTIDWIEVRWRSDRVDRHTQLPVDRLLTFKEGHDVKIEKLKEWAAQNEAKSASQYDSARSVMGLDGKRVPLTRPGKLAVINFWAPWCAPCLEEMPLLQAAAVKYHQRVQFVGVSVERQNLASVSEALSKTGANYRQVIADDALMENFFGSDGEAPLPATFIFHEDGSLHRIFNRLIDEQELDDILEILAGQQANVHHLQILAEVHLGQKEYQKARSLFEQILEIQPNDASALVQYGSTLSFLGQNQESLMMLMRASRLSPKDPYVWYRLGWAQKLIGDMVAAAASYRVAFDLKDDSFQYGKALAAALTALGQHEESNRIFEALVLKHPKHVEIWVNLGKTRAVLSKQNAEDAFVKALDLAPGHTEANRLLRVWRAR
jgi:tetratricopeptide (TPR) repeat protein